MLAILLWLTPHRTLTSALVYSAHHDHTQHCSAAAAAAAIEHAFALQTAVDIDGRERHLSEFAGKVTMVVNVASQCGFTDENYKGVAGCCIRQSATRMFWHISGNSSSSGSGCSTHVVISDGSKF
jgi:hypothetical protein